MVLPALKIFWQKAHTYLNEHLPWICQLFIELVSYVINLPHPHYDHDLNKLCAYRNCFCSSLLLFVSMCLCNFLLCCMTYCKLQLINVQVFTKKAYESNLLHFYLWQTFFVFVHHVISLSVIFQHLWYFNKVLAV